MNEEWYQGYVIVSHPEPKTGATSRHWFEARRADGTGFTLISTADYTTSGVLGEDPDDLAEAYGRSYVHGVIDLDRFDPGAELAVEVPSEPRRDGITDDELESELLRALRAMARVANATSRFPHLDVDGVSLISGTSRDHVKAVLGEMSLAGWVEGAAESLAAGLTEGRCRLTPAGLAEARQRGARRAEVARPRPEEAQQMYDVSVSFAGEDREYVEETVRALQELGLSVFYDLDHQPGLWGKDLAEELHKVYAMQSRRVLMFVSDAYVDKSVPTHERRSALSRAISEPNQPYVLQVRLSDTDVPGVPANQVWTDGRELSPREVAERVAEHLRSGSDSSPSTIEPAIAQMQALDRELYERFAALLPSTGVIHWLGVHGLSPSWEPRLLASLREFRNEWDNAEHEFLDAELEQLRATLLNSVDALLTDIAANTFRLDNGRQGIPPEWEDTQRERAIEVERELFRLGDAVVAAHQSLMRAARKRM